MLHVVRCRMSKQQPPQKQTFHRPKAKAKPAALPLLPQHRLPQPFARLLDLGENDKESAYREVAAEIRQGDVAEGVRRLTEMALDETYYRYFEGNENDTRGYTRVHAVRALEELGEDAAPAIEPLLPLLGEEDDWVREEMPLLYTSIGPKSIPALSALLTDPDADSWAQTGAGDSLAEMTETHPAVRNEVVALLEQALVAARDETQAAFLVCNLLDVGAKESLLLIEQAFRENRVDDSIVEMVDVQDHFGLPVTYERRKWESHLSRPDASEMLAPDAEAYEDGEERETEDAEEAQTPYVASVKVGRNDPCPCGSGKKYKKCHGQ